MRYTQAEKMEIIRLVEQSELSVKQCLKELGVARSSFYSWYKCYQKEGFDGLANRSPQPRQIWNRIPDEVRQHVVEVALEHTDKSPRQLAWHITDTEAYFISESSVYRILKGFDLVTSPVFQLVTASDEFHHKTKQVNEMWQTDFTQFKVVGWGGTICARYWTTSRAISWPGGWLRQWPRMMSRKHLTLLVRRPAFRAASRSSIVPGSCPIMALRLSHLNWLSI